MTAALCCAIAYRSISSVLNTRLCLRLERMAVKRQSVKDELWCWQNPKMRCISHLTAYEEIDFMYVVCYCNACFWW